MSANGSSEADMDFQDEMKARSQHVNAVIRDYMPKESGFQKTLLSAMNYSIEAGGKRLRPIMLECTYQMYGGTGALAGPFMAAMEMIHTSSLIHDDLPALDNDSMRRGRKTTHKVYGEAMAILAGDALMNYAYETACAAFSMAKGDQISRVAKALTTLGAKSGIYGMLGGQSCDVECEGRELTEGQVEFINQYKTSALIEASLMIGAILAGAPDEEVAILESVGSKAGQAFQIRDDILDVTGSETELGKPIGSDVRNRKTTFISLFGISAGRARVERLSEQALEAFDQLSAKHEFLRRFIEELVNRRS